MKFYNTTNLVTHLKFNHSSQYVKLTKLKSKRKVKEKQLEEIERPVMALMVYANLLFMVVSKKFSSGI